MYTVEHAHEKYFYPLGDYMTQHQEHLYRMLADLRREYEIRITPIVDELVRLENLSERPNVFLVAEFANVYVDKGGIKKAPAGEDRGQGGKTKETTTKNESSV